MDRLLLYNLAFLLLTVGVFYYFILQSILSRNKKFECIRCKRCCGLIVRLSEKDIERIKTDKKFVVNIFGKKYMKMKKGRCVFFEVQDGKSFCSIHDMRPELCRQYPKIKIFGIKCQDAMCKGLK